MSTYDWMEDDALSGDDIRARISGLERAEVLAIPGVHVSARWVMVVPVAGSQFQSGSPITVKAAAATTSGKDVITERDPALAST